MTVAGLGLHGGAVGNIKWLVQQGAIITATDLKSESELAASLKKLDGLPIKFVLGQHNKEDFTKADLIIRNPAMPRASEFLQAAREAGVPVAMDSNLFFDHSPTRDIIGVTGSKGKTTTAHAIQTVLQKSNPQTISVGTDGISPLEKLPDVTADATVVFELSSWRLEALDEYKISPPVAVVTSIYREHLNTYYSLEDYINIKKTIFRYQGAKGIAILNYDDGEIRRWQKDTPGQIFWYSLKNLIEAPGIYATDGKITVNDGQRITAIMPVDNLPVTADHTRRNLLPAILLGHLRGMTAGDITEAISQFKTPAHRLEHVSTINNVTYINDSASTMPDATIAALQSFGQQSLVLILGGNDKKLDFANLAAQMAQSNVRAVVWLPGTATDRMKKAVSNKKYLEQDANNMVTAVQQVQRIAQPGDTVLLSPGATSFGLFQHEFDRGDQFRQAVLELAG